MQEIEASASRSNPSQETFSASPQPLRLWPGLVIGGLLILVVYVLPLIAPDAEINSVSLGMISVIAGLLGGLAAFVWWIFFSRAAKFERFAALVLAIVALVITKLVAHPSIAQAGMGMLLIMSALPGMGLALVAWAWLTQRFSDSVRRVSLVVALVLACVPWILLRTAGVTASGSEYHWRWTPTPEEKLLAQANDDPKPLPSATPEIATAVTTPSPAANAPLVLATPAVANATTTTTNPNADWPGFRGRNRDGVIHAPQIKTDWAATPPVEMWRKPIGPGWSSFAVRGDLLYTQEQRGNEELVACYKVSTGEPVWRHRDAVRFWESNGGAGPRATPTLNGNRVFAFGATGILNALDANSGKLIWTRNVATDTSRKVPTWGFASSPLVVDDVVIVAAASTLAAYNLTDGKPRWQGPAYDGGYSSPQRLTVDGVTQVLLLGGPGALSLAPATGAVLWEHKWESGAITQPALLSNGDIIINAIATSGGIGTRRLNVKQNAGAWTLAERWTSNGLKPYFSDFVTHKGFAYGFDGTILSCISLEDGNRKWKGGRYGNGQLVLLADQDLLLVVTEEGELALVSATTDQFKEITRIPGLEGKTWNHPVVVGDILLVRNGEQMAAFRLPVAGG